MTELIIIINTIKKPRPPGRKTELKSNPQRKGLNMKTTISQLIESSNIPERLIKKTINQFGGWSEFKDLAPDVINHGIGGGFHGFIYYSDTVDFFNKNKDDILKMAKDQAEDFGMSMTEMVQGFNCMKGLDLTIDEFAETFFTGEGELDTQIFNCLAWYAGEEVCRAYIDLEEK